MISSHYLQESSENGEWTWTTNSAYLRLPNHVIDGKMCLLVTLPYLGMWSASDLCFDFISSTARPPFSGDGLLWALTIFILLIFHLYSYNYCRLVKLFWMCLHELSYFPHDCCQYSTLPSSKWKLFFQRMFELPGKLKLNNDTIHWENLLSNFSSNENLVSVETYIARRSFDSERDRVTN